MPARRLLVATAFAAITCVMGQAHAAEPQNVQTFEKTLTRTVSYKYLLSLPTGYEAKSERRWPVILFLHGAGERGDDVWSIARHGPPKLLRAEGGDAPDASKALKEQFIVVSPQCPKNRWWDTEAVLALLDHIEATHAVDLQRVYLTGLSMGGFATWELGLAHPDRFAAIMPICGGGAFATVFDANQTRRTALHRLGVWAFHGAKDPTVPLIESERMVELLKKTNHKDVQLTVYPEAKHDSWTETYANPEVYAWLLRHQLAPAAAK